MYIALIFLAMFIVAYPIAIMLRYLESKHLWNSLDDEQKAIIRETSRNEDCLGCRILNRP